MKVLMIGYSKTGTKTMHAALNILGYKVYDFDHNWLYLRKEWMKIFTKGGTKEDFYNMYKDVDATVDIPACIFWEEILGAFPDVKLIFNERNSEEEWWQSLMKTQRKVNNNFTVKFVALFSPTSRSMFRMAHHCGRIAFGAPPQRFWSCLSGMSPNVAKMMYRNHNARVKERAPKGQLLCFKPTEGWKPLCEFLGKTVPDQDFPYANKGGTIVDEWIRENPIIQKMKYEAVISMSSLLLSAMIFLFMFLIVL